MVKGDADLNVLARIEPNADASKWPAGRLTEFLRSGFDALNLIPSGHGHDEQAERLAVDVLPAVRAG